MSVSKISFYVNKKRGSLTVPVPAHIQQIEFADDVVPKPLSQGFQKLSVTGSQHRLFIAPTADTRKAVVGFKGARNTLIIGSNTTIRGTIAIQGSDLTVLIGAGTTFNNVEIFCKGSKNGVYIGRDCMFSAGIEIRTSDAHSIVDLDTMKKTNHPDGVYIGDHVWVSKNAFIQKGSTIGDDNVIGYGAMTRGDMDITNSILVGVPAKPVPDRRTTWSRKSKVKDADIRELNAWQKLPLL